MLSLLGFMAEYVLRPVIPLIIIDRGGDATLIGLVTGVFALPSIGLRPIVGSLMDRWRQRRVLGLGTLLATVAPAGLLVPNLLSLVVARFAQGGAWALFTVSTRTLMAQATPPDRRAEASAYFAAMPALALLLAPGAGVALYLATGALGPILLATVLALTTLAILLRLPALETPSSPPDGPARRRVLGWFFEPTVFPAMAMTGAFMAAETLFSIFTPVFVRAAGEGIESLAIYYPVYGLASTVSLFIVGRLSNRLPRGRALRSGAAFAVAGITIAILADGLVVFGLGAAVYAVGAAFASAALGALSIDQAPRHRLGSAMATYSIGFQLAIGASAVLWGPLISSFGFDIALGGALTLVLIVVAASYRYADVKASVWVADAPGDG